MKPKPLPSQEYLRSVLRYIPDTGLLYWRHKNKAVRLIVHIAGYLQIILDGVIYMAHRVIFKMYYNMEPEEIDHENRIKTDNRIINLRPANGEINKRNSGKQKNNTSGFTGVTWVAHCGKWKAQLWRNKTTVYLGYFETPEAAAEARKKANEMYGFHPTHGLA